MKKIIAKKADVKNNDWILYDAEIFNLKEGIFEKEKNLKLLEIKSNYNYEKITTLFKNFNTMSFVDIVINYNSLSKEGYNKRFLDQSLHNSLSLPFFLFMMTAIASILTMGTLKRSENFKFIVVGLISSALIFYFKDLSLALGQTDRYP